MDYYGEHDADTLGTEEFAESLLYLTSKKIVSEEYIQKNEPFFNAILMDLYESYLNGVSITILSTILENFLYNLFLYKPGVKNI